MNVLEEILEEIEERVNMVENIPVDEDDGFLDGESVMKPEEYKVDMKS